MHRAGLMLRGMRFMVLLLALVFVMGEASAQQSAEESLIAENRKLAQALAETTAQFLKLKEQGGACAEAETLAVQNESLRETIKAQNEVLAHCSGGETPSKTCPDAADIAGLKETIRQLKAQNEHLSSAGTMGKTVTNQIISLQDRITALQNELEEERAKTRAFREKLVSYEQSQAQTECAQAAAIPTEINPDVEAENTKLMRELTDIKLKNQELKARLDLLQQKAQ